MKKNVKIYRIVLLSLVCVIFIMTIIYASLSSTFTINTSTVNQEYIYNIEYTSQIYTPTVVTTSSNGISCSNAVFNSGTGILEIGDNELSKPGDKCYWKITVKNTGLFDALLNGYYFNPGSNTCTKYNNNNIMVCGSVTYMLSSSPSEAVSSRINKLSDAQRTVTADGGEMDIYIIAFYNQSDYADSETIISPVYFNLTFTQQ